MLAATSSPHSARSGGIRHANLAQDLRPIADLIEICFSEQLDAGGRATIQDMRGLARLGPLLHLLAMGDRMLRGIGQGFVWEDGGRIVGNVTLFPAAYPAKLGRVIVIANVAVAPEYRRQGIAKRLMDAGLEAIRAGGGTAIILQVEGDNDAARHLYYNMGFRSERVWHNWYRGSHLNAPPQLMHSPYITLRPGNLWKAEYALAARLFPAEQGGLGWQRPLHPREFHRPPLANALGLMGGESTERWIVREGQAIRGSLWARTKFGGGPIRLTMLVPPEEHAALAEPLLNYALRRLVGGYRSLSVEHPTDDVATSDLLKRHRFTVRRTLEHMRLDL